MPGVGTFWRVSFSERRIDLKAVIAAIVFGALIGSIGLDLAAPPRVAEAPAHTLPPLHVGFSHSRASTSPPGAPRSAVAGGVVRSVVSAGLSTLNVLINAPPTAADAGVAYPMNVTVTGCSCAPSEILWSDTLGQTGGGPTFGLFATQSANVTVYVEVFLTTGDILTASRAVQVVGDPSLVISSPTTVDDVGVAIPIDLRVSAGAPPYRLDWGIAPAAPANRTTELSDGVYRVWVAPHSAGEILVTASLEDYWNLSQSVTMSVGDGFPLPSWSVSLSSPLVEVGIPANLRAVLHGGAPPINWSVVPSEPSWNSTIASGTVGEGGTIVWTGAFETPGNLTVSVWGIDESGQSAVANASLRVVPALAVALFAASSTVQNGAVNLTGIVAGGEPPFTITWAVPGTAQVDDRAGVDGPISWAVPLSQNLGRTVTVTVTDRLGISALASILLLSGDPVLRVVNSTPSALGGNSDNSITGITGTLSIAGVVGVGLVGVLLFRRRRRGPAGPTPADEGTRASAVVRRLLESSDGLERETLDLLAEEEGVPTPKVAAAIERWTRGGKIRTEEGVDGQIRLHWSTGTSSHAPDEPLPRDPT